MSKVSMEIIKVDWRTDYRM